MAKRLEPAEWLTLIGGVAGLLGQGIRVSGVGPKGLSDLLTVIGIGVFLFGVVYAVRDVNKRLGTLDATALAHHVDELANRVTALAGAYGASKTASTVARVLEWAKANPQHVHFRAASSTVNHLFNTYSSPIVVRLERFIHDQSLTLEIAHFSPVHEFMWQLGNELPVGGAWFGITLLDRREAWEGSDASFGRFVEQMRERANPSDLAVARLYYFRTWEAFDAMRDLLETEQGAEVAVRCLVTGPAPPDLSLLWSEPSAGAKPAVGPEHGGRGKNERPSTGPDTGDVVMHARRSGRTPICVLYYDAHGGSHLTRVTMHPGASAEFARAAETFATAWHRAQTLEAALTSARERPN